MKYQRIALLLVTFVGCGGNGKDPSGLGAVGSEGGACYGNNTCDSGLTCASKLCVRLSTGIGLDAGTPDAPSSSDVQSDAPFSEAEIGTMVRDGALVDVADDTGPASCPIGGNGSLLVTISGLPVGVAASGLAVSAADQMQVLTTAGTVALPSGPYSISVGRVTVPDSIARTVYEGAASPSVVCVPSAGSTAVSLTYSVIATSNKVWTGNVNGAPGITMLGFASAVLAASGAPPATIPADTNGSGGFAFDRDGNMWVTGGTTADAPLARYRAGMFTAGGAKSPDITIGTAAFSAGSPGAKAMAFDASGSLWVTTGAARKIVKITAAQLAVTATVVPTVEVSELPGLESIAFDMAGNLWFGYAEGLGYIAAASLAASRVGVDYTFKVQSGPPVTADYGPPTGLAFDATGNLWGAFGTSLIRLTPAERTMTGGKQKVVVPSIALGGSVLGLPDGIAFDEGGALWVAGSAGKFLRFGPAKLAAGGDVTPDVVISSPSTGSAGAFALYPAPAGLPIYHRLP